MTDRLPLELVMSIYQHLYEDFHTCIFTALKFKGNRPYNPLQNAAFQSMNDLEPILKKLGVSFTMHS